MISGIDISQFAEYKVTDKDSGNLDDLSRINVLVGANNSGKSRFLRKLLTNKLSIQLKEVDLSAVRRIIKDLKSEAEAWFKKIGSTNQEIHLARMKVVNIPDVIYLDNINLVQKVSSEVEELSRTQSNIINDGRGVNTQHVFNQFRKFMEPYKIELSKVIQTYDNRLFEYKKSYIPILRGLRPLQITDNDFDNTKDNYSSRITFDYKFSKDHNITLHTGLSMYKNVTELLLGDHDDRLKVQEFEMFLRATFFQQQAVHIVPRIGQDVLNIKIGNDKQYPIYELGEGIQSIILLTYPLFFNHGENIVFFIEEPELHLHPGLERIFIETLRNPQFSSFQYFITTHSNHILDLTLEYDDISVYSFEKKRVDDGPDFFISNVNSNHKQLLELLGVRNSSVFLSNCTIWVEGITDRLYLRKFLEVWQNANRNLFKEDYHYSFIEYAGNNITHWSFLESDDAQFSNINIEGICSKIFLIADNDGVNLPSKRGKEKKLQRQQQLAEKLGDHFYLTKGVEVENTLSKEVIKRVIIEMEGSSNGIDFTAFDKADHTNKYLGDFIEKSVTGHKRKYCSDYGTIHDKLNFCKKAVNQIKTVNDLSAEAVDLTQKLLAFIAGANR